MANHIYICCRARNLQIGGIALQVQHELISTAVLNPGEQNIRFTLKFQVGLFHDLILRSIAQEKCTENVYRLSNKQICYD